MSHAHANQLSAGHALGADAMLVDNTGQILNGLAQLTIAADGTVAENEDIARFVTAGIETVSINGIAEEDHECNICRDGFIRHDGQPDMMDVDGETRPTPQEQPVRIIICGHIFGFDCLRAHLHAGQPWSRLCPLCRAPLFGAPRHVVDAWDYLRRLILHYDDMLDSMNYDRLAINASRTVRQNLLDRLHLAPELTILGLLSNNRHISRLIDHYRACRAEVLVCRVRIQNWVEQRVGNADFLHLTVEAFNRVRQDAGVYRSLDDAWLAHIGYSNGRVSPHQEQQELYDFMRLD